MKLYDVIALAVFCSSRYEGKRVGHKPGVILLAGRACSPPHRRIRYVQMRKPLLWLCLLLTCFASLHAQSLRDLVAKQPPLEFTQEGCPSHAVSVPIDQTPIAPTDFIEFDVVAAFLPPGPYQVRVFADGRVERETSWCPLHAEDRTIYVDPEVAQKLLVRARDGGFRQLCARYTFAMRPDLNVDGNETSIMLSLHGQSSTVVNSLGKPPSIYNELSDAIAKISPMRKLADYYNFTPERKAECDAIRAKRMRQQ